MKIKGFIQFVSKIVLFIAFLSLFAHLVKHVESGGNELGIMTNPFRKFIYFPSNIKKVYNELFGLPPTYIKKDQNLNEINNLEYDLYALNSYFDTNNQDWSIQLSNLRNDSLILTWKISHEDFYLTDRQFRNAEPRNGIILDDKSLIITCDESQNLYRLDSTSSTIWHNTEKKYHHALNLAIDGNIWICSSASSYLKNAHKTPNNFKFVEYRDDFITKVDSKTGEIIFDKSVSELLVENGYINFVFGFGNQVHPVGTDPLHLNDIEPALTAGKYWEKGDLFISLRHRSLIILYRPSTGKIIRLIYGPFLTQHDVDIISEHEISIFNNNVSNLFSTRRFNQLKGRKEFDFELNNSNVLIYDFEDSTFRQVYEKQFQDEEIFTHTEGMYTFLSNGDLFVENQNHGLVYILSKNNIIMKKYLGPTINGQVDCPHWIRIYEDIKF